MVVYLELSEGETNRIAYTNKRPRIIDDGGRGDPHEGGGVIPDTPSPYPTQFYGSQAN